MCIFCILNGEGASMIPIQSSVHVFDEMLARQRLADILFCSCKLYFLAPPVFLHHLHINILYANVSPVSLRPGSGAHIGLSATL